MLKETANAILDEPINISITTEKRSWFRPWKKTTVKKDFQLKPLCIGSLVRISKITLEIDPDLVSKGMSMLDMAYVSANAHGRNLARIVAIALTNSRQDPPESLVDLIESNVTSQQLLQIYMEIIKQMDVTPFMTSIVSIRGINLLERKTNPVEQRSQIASGEQSED